MVWNFQNRKKNYLLDIVRLVLTSCVGAGKKLEELSFSAVPDPKLAEKCGAFVTYHIKNGSEKELRGCIGHMEGIYPLWETVARMAYSAAFHDTRFLPVEKKELPFIDYEITVLTPFEPCEKLKILNLAPMVFFLNVWDAGLFFFRRFRRNRAGIKRRHWSFWL